MENELQFPSPEHVVMGRKNWNPPPKKKNTNKELFFTF